MLINQDNPLKPCLMHAVMLSMYPLLEKDGLQEAYLGLIIVHLGLTLLLRSIPETIEEEENSPNKTLNTPWSRSPLLSLVILGIIHLIRMAIPAPTRYPFLWDALMVSWSFLQFIQVFYETYQVQLRATTT